MATRLSTWENRYGAPATGTERLRAVFTRDDDPFGLGRRQRAGLHRIENAADLSLPFGENASLADESILLGGSWDQRQLRFENEGDHSPLTVDKLAITVASRVLRTGFNGELGLANELRLRTLITEPEEGWIDKDKAPSAMLDKKLEGLGARALAKLKQELKEEDSSLAELKQAMANAGGIIQQLLPDDADSDPK